jgi:DNA-binding MarR family transcriptional regulator
MENDEYEDYRLFQELNLRLDHADTLVLRAFNLTTTQFYALRLLDTEEGWRLTDMSKRLLCERSTVTRLVDFLEGEGLVFRTADSVDRRSQRVTLTPAGVLLRAQAQAALQEAIRQRFSVLSHAELHQLLEMHRRLSAVVSAEIEHGSQEPINTSL